MSADHRSLEEQIRDAEFAIRARHHIVAERTARVARMLKKRVTSPLALVAAFGGGFILDRLVRLIPRRIKRRVQPGEQTKPSLIARVMEIVVLARTLLTAWPAALFRRIISLGSMLPAFRPSVPVRTEYPPHPDIYP